MCCARSRLDVSCSVHSNVGPAAAASMVWKMVLFQSFRFSDLSPSRITPSGGNRCLCVPRSALQIIRPRVRHSREAWWISGGTAKGKAATLTGISVLSTYNCRGLLPCRGCICSKTSDLQMSRLNRTRTWSRKCPDCRHWKSKLSRDGVQVKTVTYHRGYLPCPIVG
jgi:hypothetical protein